jgi:hypothetical protein
MTEARPIDPQEALSVTLFEAPGSGTQICYLRDKQSGSLRAIEAAGRRYLEVRPDGSLVFDEGFVVMRERRLAEGIERSVETAERTWLEHYRWDSEGRLVHVDGVEVRRDGQGRVIACLPGGSEPAPAEHQWFYVYGPRGIAMIEGPFGRRQLACAEEGRIVGSNQDGRERRFDYDRAGRRLGVAPPPQRRFHRDEAGRLWAVSDPEGRVIASFLWDGYRCLARIWGKPGRPLDAVFCLDPSATPVLAPPSTTAWPTCAGARSTRAAAPFARRTPSTAARSIRVAVPKRSGKGRCRANRTASAATRSAATIPSAAPTRAAASPPGWSSRT